MGVQWTKLWQRVRESFWFLPGGMAIAAGGLSVFTVWLDGQVTDKAVAHAGWIYSGGAAGASAVLSTIASSMMTITGVVFSMTLVALSLASTQFGPRLLRNFMRDTSNQVVLGTFVATFLYSLLVLRTIRREDEGAFVPHISVTVGVGLALVSLGVLIYFIHHVSISIQADEIIARVSADLTEGIDRLYPVRIGEAQPQEPPADSPIHKTEGHPIAAESDGYVQLIDPAILIAAAEKWDVILRVERRPGHYVTRGAPLARCWPPERCKEELAEAVRGAFGVGNERTPQQDVEFAVLQLVEIAVRALSPGVNDPFTAVTCLDRLGSALRRLATREEPSAYRCGKDGKLRVIAAGPRFPRVVEAAYDQIRQNARSSIAVSIRLLESLATVAEAARRPADREAILRQAEYVVQGIREQATQAADLSAVEQRYGGVMKAAGGDVGGA